MRTKRGVAWAASASLALTATVIALAWQHLPYWNADSHWYRLMAEGRRETVLQPFANRVLHPALARMLAGGTGSIDAGFRLLGILSLALLTVSVSLLLTRHLRRPWAVIPLMLTPFLLQLFGNYYLPDLLHDALLGLFLLVFASSPWASLAILPVLFLSRETTALLSLVLAILAWRRGRRALASAVLAISAAGLICTGALRGSAAGNVHALGGVAYLVLKAPFNIARNVFGVELWVNTIPYCDPVRVWALPAWLNTAAVKEVGLCSWSGVRPLHLLVYWLTTFGLLPVILGLHLARPGRQILRRAPLWMSTALVYGFLGFLLAPAMGAATDRLVGYGWPAFWLAAPLILIPALGLGRRELVALIPLHLAICWMPMVARALIADKLIALGATVLIVVPLHLLALRRIHGVGRLGGVVGAVVLEDSRVEQT